MPPPKRSCSCNGKSQGGQLGQEASKQRGKEEGKTNILLKLSCCTACQFVQQAKHTRLSLERQLACLMPSSKANGYTHVHRESHELMQLRWGFRQGRVKIYAGGKGRGVKIGEKSLCTQARNACNSLMQCYYNHTVIISVSVLQRVNCY